MTPYDVKHPTKTSWHVELWCHPISWPYHLHVAWWTQKFLQKFKWEILNFTAPPKQLKFGTQCLFPVSETERSTYLEQVVLFRHGPGNTNYTELLKQIISRDCKTKWLIVLQIWQRCYIIISSYSHFLEDIYLKLKRWNAHR